MVLSTDIEAVELPGFSLLRGPTFSNIHPLFETGSELFWQRACCIPPYEQEIQVHKEKIPSEREAGVLNQCWGHQ